MLQASSRPPKVTRKEVRQSLVLAPVHTGLRILLVGVVTDPLWLGRARGLRMPRDALKAEQGLGIKDGKLLRTKPSCRTRTEL